jgi:predicted O-methyltransferase YrrM
MIPFRFVFIAGPYVSRKLWLAVTWAFRSKEYYNHTYNLSPLNKQYLASFIAVVTGYSVGEIEQYIRELETDICIAEELRKKNASSKDRYSTDDEPRYGRRLGWYALVRATKPRVVVETGIDRGLGTVVIAAALKRNSEDGYPGRLYATDIVQDCGHLVSDAFKPYYEKLIGDSVTSLQKLRVRVDVFLHDSDHRPEYEWAEFLAVEPSLTPDAIVMSDNSQETTKLREFAERTGRSFLYFQDIPQQHWWPGDGIGCAFRPGYKYGYQSGNP